MRTSSVCCTQQQRDCDRPFTRGTHYSADCANLSGKHVTPCPVRWTCDTIPNIYSYILGSPVRRVLSVRVFLVRWMCVSIHANVMSQHDSKT
eukprot:357723-Chlamydomonas_euryale.AAC.16